MGFSLPVNVHGIFLGELKCSDKVILYWDKYVKRKQFLILAGGF